MSDIDRAFIYMFAAPMLLVLVLLVLEASLRGSVFNMNDRARMVAEICRLADDLTDAKRHTEPIQDYINGHWQTRRAHQTWQPSLFDQLSELLEEALQRTHDTHSGTCVGGTLESRPPLDVNVLSGLHEIERQVTRWVNFLDLDLRTDLSSSVRQLVARIRTTGSDTQAQLLAELRRWHTLASTLTGWSTPLRRPYSPCPCCQRRTGLVVNLDRCTAFCAGCMTTWTTLEELRQAMQPVA